jgi:signal transduction histidine kinase
LFINTATVEPLQFSLHPYFLNALALFFIGLAGTLYMLRIQEKTAATRLVTLALAGFSVGMACWAATGIVLWGSALTPLTDACSVVSMAAMIEFGYHYPQKVQSFEANLARLFARGVGLGALAFSLLYASRFLFSHIFTQPIPQAFWLLNPITSLVALGVCVRRMMAVQHQQQPGNWRSAFSAFRRPNSRPVRLLRNFFIALSFGLIQGLISILSPLGWSLGAADAILIDLSFSLMMIAVVYTVFELTDQQPRLLVRLIGLSLVTILGLIGIVGMFTFNLAYRWVGERTRADLALAQAALIAGDFDSLPKSIRYIITWPKAGPPDTGSVLYANPSERNTPNWLSEPSLPAAWVYFVHLDLAPFTPAHQRYGSHPAGSYYEFAGFPAQSAANDYEIGFSLAEMSHAILVECRWVLWMMLGVGLIVLGVFPRFYHTNLIRPLDRLLAGVREADGGRLDILVPVTYQDEIGFLTAAFNKMTASLSAELAQRQRAEAELRQLNLTLEQRVADRTHELEALYDVSAAASQAQAPQELLNLLLERTLAALRSPMGMILLLEESSPPNTLLLAADCGLPPGWQTYLNTASDADVLFASVLNQPDPLLIVNTHRESRLPNFVGQTEPLTMLLAALPAEGQVMGLMGVARPAERGFDLDEVALFVSLVRQVGTAVHTDHLRQAAQRATVLEDRQRLARDLHDSVTQSLYGLAALTEAGKMRLETGDVETSTHLLTRIGQTARQAIREMRLFLHQLRPPVLEQEGLASALELRLAAVEGRSDVRASLEADESIPLSVEVETALYHIAQEALNNALKHAAASSVTVRLYQTDEGVILEIADDGCGFDPAQVNGGGMGLGNMRARAEAIGAALEIHSRPGEGTQVKVSVRQN